MTEEALGYDSLGISLQMQGASGWAGTARGDKLTWDVQVHAMPDEAEPDDEIRPGGDAPCICKLGHGIRRVARVDKKGRSARFWMVLRKMSSCNAIFMLQGTPTPTLIPPMNPSSFNCFLYCSGTTY